MENCGDSGGGAGTGVAGGDIRQVVWDERLVIMVHFENHHKPQNR